jgi:hypothetical protein
LVTTTLVQDVGNTVAGVGDGVGQVGDSLSTVPVVGGVVQSAANTAGNVVSTLGDGVANGIGKLGTVDNGLGVTGLGRRRGFRCRYRRLGPGAANWRPPPAAFQSSVAWSPKWHRCSMASVRKSPCSATP